MLKLAAVLLSLLLAQSAHACLHSPKARAQFKHDNPCPANGRQTGACPGWIVDHVIALCVGGKDKPSNMQWMDVASAKAKDKWECKRSPAKR